jgi:putative phage-type endonuclease
VTLHGVPIPPLVPGSREWLSKMSASKVAAVMGLSPYDSRFSLYYRMLAGVGDDIESDEMRRGNYLEPAITAWFADQHPEWSIEPGGCWQHPAIEWYTAAPDRLVKVDAEIRGLECKSEADGDGWGEPGSDVVPVEVRAQVMAQMDVLGTRRTHVAVLLPFLEFREYVVDYDEADATVIREACAEFMEQLAARIAPNLDDHVATLRTVRLLHPDIDPVDVEVSPQLAERYQQACQACKDADAAKRLASAEVLEAIGNGRRAMCLGEPIASRVAVGDNPPHLRPAKARQRSAAA